MSNTHRIWPVARGFVCGLVILYMLVPLAIVVIISFSSAPFLTFPPPGFSLQWYKAVWDPVWLTESHRLIRRPRDTLRR
jgi:putative spermidine/putrescine transport system permease protein